MERRKGIRRDKNLLVYLKEESVELLGVTSNISKTGFFVESIKVFHSPQELSIVLAADNQELFNIKGEVMWNKTDADNNPNQIPSGMGIKILEAPAEYWNYMEYIKYDDSIMV